MIKLYTIGCPACKVLQKKLINADLSYSIINNHQIFEQLNITIFPMLQVDEGPLMTYGEALAWLKQQEGVSNTTNGNN